jgi:hypothetical protein
MLREFLRRISLYACTVPPEMIPPIGERHLLHLFQHPDCVNEDSICIDQVPKKLRELLKCSGGVNPSRDYSSLRIGSRRRFDSLPLCFFRTRSFLIGVLWAVYKHSVQDSFAIASYMVAFGTLQALLVI